MKFCPVVPENCRGQVHVPRKKERRRIIIIRRRNGPKTISLPNLKILEIEAKSIHLTHNYMTTHCCPGLVQAFQ
jgi:hypothetical protein